MVGEGLLFPPAETFEELMTKCFELQGKLKRCF